MLALQRSSGLVAVLALALALTASASDGEALPTDLRADFGLGSCASFEVPAGDPRDTIAVRCRYDNTGSEATVTFVWGVRHRGAGTTLVEQELPVAFRPMAITPRAGTTDTVYVAGWRERPEGHLVLERWTLVAPESIGASADGMTTCSRPRVVRSPLATGRDWPLWSMVCSPFGPHDRLFLLRHFPQADAGRPAPVAEIWEYDTADEVFVDHDGDGVPDPRVSSATLPTLVGTRDLFTARIPELGFVVAAAPSPRWDKSCGEDRWTLLVDEDLTGDVSAPFTVETKSFLQTHPYATWDGSYTR
ncbi:MAG: hypothetical protein H6825_11760 [Planctomycetes bacterium]|nr:hypothetical protein [Planctomycetota bacterium]